MLLQFRKALLCEGPSACGGCGFVLGLPFKVSQCAAFCNPTPLSARADVGGAAARGTFGYAAALESALGLMR